MLPKAIAKYLVDPDYYVTVKANRIAQSSGFRAKVMYARLWKKYTVLIADTACIGDNLQIRHYPGVIIGAGVCIGDDCTLYQSVTIGQNRGLFPKLGNNVIVYTGAVIVGDIKVGDNAIIGANSVVTKDVPDNAIVGGIPAVILGFRRQGDSSLF